MRVLLFCILISASSYGQVMKQENSCIYIASYNIYTFGLNNSIQAYNAAKVLSSGDFDLVAIQEVMNVKGENAVNQLITYLKDSFNLNYKAVISPNIGDGFRDQERIAFVYKPDVLSPEKQNGASYQVIDVPDGRDFVFTRWSKGTFNFVLGSGHLYYGKNKTKVEKQETLERRLKELELVYGFFNDPLKQFGDEDLLFVGDFNRAAMVDDYKRIKYDLSKYFIPNIEFFDPGLNKVGQVKNQHIKNKGVPNDNPKLVSSTVADGNTYVYDMIICSKSLLDNYNSPRDKGIFNFDFGVISYDETDGIGYIPNAKSQASHNDLKEAYSDHRPVWIKLKY
ncbi:hypothetical protein [Fluviicola sp.]|uniref:hypothetical protein n=1 Tax=Fluviicola sp. TaxID=1917219 RepID=UPI003D29EADB